MSTKLHLAEPLIQNSEPVRPPPVMPPEKEAPQQTIAKFVALGELVGVNASQMILLLHSGLTVGELLEVLAGRISKVGSASEP
jgi:hypothetical protein